MNNRKIIKGYKTLISSSFNIDTSKDKPLGYYSDLENAIKKISRLGLANQKEDYTLAGFIESFNNIKDQLPQPFKTV